MPGKGQSDPCCYTKLTYSRFQKSRESRNPKPEIRKKAEARSPNQCALACFSAFGFRPSGTRISDFDLEAQICKELLLKASRGTDLLKVVRPKAHDPVSNHQHDDEVDGAGSPARQGVELA